MGCSQGISLGCNLIWRFDWGRNCSQAYTRIEIQPSLPPNSLFSPSCWQHASLGSLHSSWHCGWLSSEWARAPSWKRKSLVTWSQKATPSPQLYLPSSKCVMKSIPYRQDSYTSQHSLDHRWYEGFYIGCGFQGLWITGHCLICSLLPDDIKHLQFSVGGGVTRTPNSTTVCWLYSQSKEMQNFS